MTRSNPPSTPISPSKSAAMSRVIDLVAKGYTRYTAGLVPERKLAKLLQKFHERYGIGCSPGQRLTRKQRRLANAALVVYLPAVSESVREGLQGSEQASAEYPEQHLAVDPEMHPIRDPSGPMVAWLLLVSPGSGRVEEEELLRDVKVAPRLIWLGYELVRQQNRGKVSWTWRRTDQEMADWYAVLGNQLDGRKTSMVAMTLERISRQPGFSGVRQQSWQLIQFALRRGYSGEVPYLHFLQRIGQGARRQLAEAVQR